MNDPDEIEHRFWESASDVMDRPDVARSTMMGLPCLRVNGAFFASFDRRTGDLLVKLPEGRVATMVSAGDAHDFAPAGRRFREWAAIAPDDEAVWATLIEQALDFVGSQPVAPPKRTRRR